MAGKRSYKKAFGKAKFRRVRKRFRSYGKKKNVVNRTVATIGKGFPKKMVMTHKYSEVVGVTGALGGIAKYQWVCNGLYDPNYTGAGHQPMYFDNMTAIYNHYCVIGSKITLRVVSSLTDNKAAMIGLYIDDDTNTGNITDPTTLNEQPSGSMKLYAQSEDTAKVFRKKWSAKKTFGGAVMSNDKLQGVAGANPTELSYYTFACRALDGESGVSFYVQADIEYITVWYELKDQAQN